MNIYANVVLGWTPILAVVSDGPTREVLQVTGWTGGSGTAPATGVYVGATGYVTNIGDAVNIKGDDGQGVDIVAGTNTISSGAVNFSASNGVTFGLSGSTMTASVRTDYQSSGNYLTTAMQSNAGSNFVNTSAGLNLTNISATLNSNSISLSVGNYITTAMASNRGTDFVQANAVFAGTNASGTIASNGISVSVNAGGGGVAISGDANSQSTGTVNFSNSNGVTFGLSNNGVMTASVSALPIATNVNDVGSAGSTGTALSYAPADHVHAGVVRVAAGSNTGNTLGDTIAKHGNWVIAGTNGITVSGSTGAGGVHTAWLSAKTDYLTTAMASNRGTDFVQATAAFAGTNASGTIASNGISVSVNAQSSVNQNASLYALGNTTQNSSTALSVNALSFNAIGSLTVGYSNGSIQLSAPNALTTQSGQAFSADASSTFQTLSFQDSNGISFSNNAGALRITHGLQFTSNTSNITSNALNTSSPRVNISAGTTSNNLSALVFSNSNNFSFGLNGSTITASYTVPTVTNSSFSVQDSATTLNPVNRIAFSTGNNITLSLSTGASSVTVGVAHNLAGTSSGFTGGASISGSMTHNSSGLAISLSHPAWITTAAQSNQVVNAFMIGTASNAATNQTSTLIGSLSFSNLNGVTFYSTASGATSGVAASVNSTSNIGLNTAQTNVTWTVNSSGLSINAAGYAGTGTTFNGANLSASMTLNSVGLNLSMSAAAPGGGGSINFSAGTTSANLASITFGDVGGVSFGLNAGVITASAPAAAASPVNFSAGTTSNNLGSVIFANANKLSFGLGTGASSQSITASFDPINIGMSTNGNTAGTTGTFDGAGLQYIFAGGNNITLSQSSNASSVTLSMHGAVGTGTSGTNVGITLDSNGIAINNTDDHVYAWELEGVQTAGTTGSTLTTKGAIYFSGGNNVTLSGNSNTIVISAGAGAAGTIQGGYTNIPFFTNTVTVAYIQSTYHVVPFWVDDNLSFDYIRFQALPVVSAASTTAATTGNATFSCGYTKTHYIGIFSMATGANSDSLQLYKSTGFTEQFSNNIACAANSTQFSYSNRWTLPCSSGNYGFTYDYSSSQASINQNSANVTGLTGTKFVEIPFGTSLSPGRYWLMYGASTTTATQSAGTTIGVRNAVSYNLVYISQAAQSIGTFGAATSNIYGPQMGLGSFTTVGGATTNSLHWSKVTVSANHPMLYFQLMRSA